MIHDVPSTHRTAAEGPVPTGSAQNRLAGKRALITGAGQGIGRETAALFAAHGATVWASDLNVTALDGLAGCRPIALDVTDADAIRAPGEEIGEIDVLFGLRQDMAVRGMPTLSMLSFWARKSGGEGEVGFVRLDLGCW